MLKHQRSNLQRVLEKNQGLTSGDAEQLVADVEKVEEALITLYISLIKDGEKDDNGGTNYQLIEDKIAETANKAINECYIMNYDWLKQIAKNIYGGERQDDEIDSFCCDIIQYAYYSRLWLEIGEDHIMDFDNFFGVDTDIE